MGTRHILHICAGGDNWDPTTEELQSIIDMFNEVNFDSAQKLSVDETIKAAVGAIATRQDIAVTTLELDEGDATFMTADPKVMREVVAHRVFSDLLLGNPGAGPNRSDDYVNGYVSALSDIRDRVKAIVAESIK